MIRIAVLQRLLHDHAGRSANERLLVRLDRSLLSGKPSASVSVGRKVVFRNSYETASILREEDASSSTPHPGGGSVVKIPLGSTGIYRFPGNGDCSIEVSIVEAPKGVRTGASLFLEPDRRDVAFFDLSSVEFPLAISPLVIGDALSPFGGAGSRKAKEIMIDRKVPRERRWGRATVRDANGKILWVPGVVRSDLAPVEKSTLQLLCLTARSLC